MSNPVQPASDKVREIIAATYQILGAYDAPEHVLDVLADPEGATQAQIDALLPFVQPVQPVCAKCDGTRVVSDGQITHSEGGVRYENGPIVCIKDCPACTPIAQPVQPAEKATCPTCEALARIVMLDQTSHDTRRKWVGLTDQEIAQLAATHLFQNVWPHSTFAAIHAIEAKLKEKNND